MSARGAARDGAPVARARQATSALTPPILAYLPQGSLDGQTTHYALGPAGYAGRAACCLRVWWASIEGAESVTANYSLRSGPATLTIIDYPTPQMAAAQENSDPRLHQGRQPGAASRGPSRCTDSDLASLEVRRSGPLVALVSGDAIPDESHKLLESVHYEADLISIPQPSESEVQRPAKLLLGIAAIVSSGPAPPFCWGSSWAAAGRCIAWRAASRLLGLRRGVHPSRSAGRVGRIRPRLFDGAASEGLMRGLSLWKTRHKP